MKNYKNKIIFDGYPRNLNQAKNLDNLLKKYNQKIDIVLKLSVSLETIKKRILERKIKKKEQMIMKEIAIKRYKTYEKSSEPVIEIIINNQIYLKLLMERHLYLKLIMKLAA